MTERLRPRRWLARVGVTILVALVVASVHARAEDPTACAVSPSFSSLRCLLDSGQYGDAERVATEWHARVVKESGLESLEVARVSDYLVEALTKRGKAGSSDTLSLAQQVVRIKEARTSPDDPDLALSLRNLGT